MADINEFRLGPGADFATDLLPQDPLLLIPGLLDVFGADERSAKGVAGGSLTGEADGVRYALVYAETRDSPLEESGQKPVFAAIERALKTVQTEAPGGGADGADLRLRWSGVNKFAADTRHKAEGEVKLLSNLSLAGSALLMLLVFRNLVVFAYLVLPILTATAWSMVVCFSVFPRVHVVTLIFTSVLVGVALDYGIYSLIHAQRTRGGLREALRDLRRPLVAGCLTSVGGFAFLVLTNLPMLQQMGLAVALGLIFSLALDFLYLPWVPALRVERAGRTKAVERPAHRLDLSGRLFPTLIVALPLVLAGWVAASRPHWNDDIRALQSVDPTMQGEEYALRALFGQAKDEKLLLTFGDGLDGAFANVSKLNATLAATASSRGGTSGSGDPGAAAAESFFNLDRLFPDLGASQRAADYLRAHPDFAGALRRALDADFNADAFRAVLRGVGCLPDHARNHAPRRPRACSRGCATCCRCRCKTLWNDEDPHVAWLAHADVGEPVQPPAAGHHRPAEPAGGPGGNAQRRAEALPGRSHPARRARAGDHRGGRAGLLRLAAGGVHADGAVVVHVLRAGHVRVHGSPAEFVARHRAPARDSAWRATIPSSWPARATCRTPRARPCGWPGA